MSLRRAGVASALLAASVLSTGCGADAGSLHSAGPTPTANGPVVLWPGRPGASVPPAEPGGAPPEYVQGIPPVKNNDVHTVDPVAVVQAEVDADPDVRTGPDGMSQQTARAVAACNSDRPHCPVLQAYYRDLTGDGRDELIVGIDLGEDMLAIRVYCADEGGRLNRIMATSDQVISVELAGRDVILRVPSGNPGYELQYAWSWDEREHTMLPTREQVVRVPDGQGAGAPPSPGRVR
ncbi:hypothetical protein [Streptomyces sp. NPDC006879]|uniref:hypothetical protein n=1 Tax=Streptomyces sp. NPDC006879 TaxID=3364767 RepID=UPI0036958D71